MQQSFNASTSLVIDAPAERVWEALTNPKLIAQWLHGTQVETTWQINSPIKYHGVWNGQPYEDKGTVIEINKPKVLRSTFWSSLSGREDKPENYQVVSYVLEAKAAKTKLTLTQSNCSTQEDANQSKKNWESALNELQGLLEK